MLEISSMYSLSVSRDGGSGCGLRTHLATANAVMTLAAPLTLEDIED